MIRAPLVTCLIAVLSVGCATRGAVHEIAADLKTVRTDLGILREAQVVLIREMTTIAAYARAAKAATEELQQAVSTANADVGRLAARLDAAEHAIRPVREVVEARTVPVASPPPADRPREIRGGSVENAYAAGVASFRAREYGQAILDFLDIVTKHPTHPLAPSAQYWIGEAYYVQHDYRQALVEFQKVVDGGSANPRVTADALLKAGLCYNNLRETARAQQAWQRLLREFPGAPAAAQARTLLSSLRSSTRR